MLLSSVGTLWEYVERGRAARVCSSRTACRYVLTRGAPISPAEAAAAGLSEAKKERLEELIRSAHAELASWSSRGAHEIVQCAGYLMQFERPDAVIAAVRRVVVEARASGSRAEQNDLREKAKRCSTLLIGNGK